MKIIAASSTELVVRDWAAPLRWTGAFLLAVGAFVVWIGMTADARGHVGVVPVVIGALLAIGGVSLLVLPARRSFAFSGLDRSLAIVRQRLGRVERQIIPFRDIADLSLQESRDDGS